jgi:hypothetical protein
LISVNSGCRDAARLIHGLKPLTERYRWTLDHTGQQSRTGLATEDQLLEILDKEALPCVMPAGSLLATMQIDIERSGFSIYDSKQNAQDMCKRN